MAARRRREHWRRGYAMLAMLMTVDALPREVLLATLVTSARRYFGASGAYWSPSSITFIVNAIMLPAAEHGLDARRIRGAPFDEAQNTAPDRRMLNRDC